MKCNRHAIVVKVLPLTRNLPLCQRFRLLGFLSHIRTCPDITRSLPPIHAAHRQIGENSARSDVPWIYRYYKTGFLIVKIGHGDGDGAHERIEDADSVNHYRR